MNYKLLKQLKDAGFKTPNWSMFSDYDEPLPNPSPIELIDACGDKIDMIMHLDGVWYVYKHKKNKNGEFCGIDIVTEGLDLETVVANFWLELNKR